MTRKQTDTMIKSESTLSRIIMINPTITTTTTTSPIKSRHKSRSVSHHHHHHHHHHETLSKMSFPTTNLANLSLLMCSTLFWYQFSILATAEQFDYTKLNLNILANYTIHSISALSPYKNNVTFVSLPFTNQSNTDLIRLYLDNDFSSTDKDKERKKLYIGAQDYLHRVALLPGVPRDSFLLEESVNVPMRNEKECKPEVDDLPLDPSTNDLKVVFQLGKASAVIACGTDDCGRCHAYLQDDFGKTYPLSHKARIEDPVDFIVSRKSMVFFPGEYNTGKSFFVGSEPDGRSRNRTTPFFSARVIVKLSQWQYTASQSRYKSSLDFYEDYRQTYPIKFVYGFTHSHFAYLLTQQPVEVNKYNESEPKFDTRLSRICIYDSHFKSYIEIPLRCRYLTEHDHNIASTATISQYISASNNNTDEDTLYVSFDGQQSPSSEICAFPMKDIERQFEFVARNCYATGDQVERIQSILGPNEKLTCTSQDGFIKTDKIVCGSDHYNQYLKGRNPLDGKHVFSLSNDYVTSLGAVNYAQNSRRKRSTNHFTYLFAGTNESRLMKLHLFNQYQLRTIKYFKQLDSAVGAFLPNPVYEPHSGNFYALTQRSLMQIPVKACSVYVSCAACLSIDEDSCFWYQDKCMHTDDVPEDARNEICPPELYNFSPKEGPPQGGTLVTLYGNNFGQGIQADKNDYAKVTIGNFTCDVTKQTQNIIECKIERVFNRTDLNLKSKIKVEVVDGKHSINMDEIRTDFLGYNINGSVVTEEPFTFTKVFYKGIHPSYGPIVDGTKVAIWGENLHIGTELIVNLGHSNCRVLKRVRKYAICESSEYNSPINSSKSYSVELNLKLDGNDVVFNSDNKLVGDGTHIFSPEHEIADRRRKKSQFPTTAAQAVQHPFDRSIEFFENVLMNHAKVLKIGKLYTYKPVPRITDIRDLNMNACMNDNPDICLSYVPSKIHSIASGGVEVWFEGVNLNSIKYPLLDVLLNGKLDDATLCNVINSTMITCTLPPLNFWTEEIVQARYVLHLDGDQWDSEMPTKNLILPNLYYHADPMMSISSTPINASDPIITIHGFNLNLDLPYQISLNNTIPCFVLNDTKANDNMLRCKVYISPEMLDAVLGKKLDLQARVGRLTYNLGQVTILVLEEPLLSTESIILIGSQVLALVLLILIVYVSYRVYKSRNIRKKYNTIQLEPYRMSLSEYFHDAYDNYELYNTLKEGGFIIEDPNLVVHIHEVRLGSGHFGNVHRGKYRDDDVAVKTLKRRETIDYVDQLQGFFMEADTMKEFNHRNVLSLIGITMDMKPIDGPCAPAILLPFMSFGDLLSYVRNENNHPNVQNLINFSIQIAEGMDYLSKLNFVHRDLAARNCLIGLFNQELVVKVSDFGLSRHFNQAKLYYRVNHYRELPYRWMPIELLDGSSIVTTKSDVWSFGVVMWELITRGHVPYGQLDFNQVRDLLRHGGRLTQFELCPDLFYSIMLECWYVNPDDRPTFENVLHMITGTLNLLQSQSLSSYINLNPNATHIFRECPLNYNISDIKNQVSNYRLKMMEMAVHQFGFPNQYSDSAVELTDLQYEEDYRLHPPPSYAAATQMACLDTMTTTTANPCSSLK